MAKSRKQIKHKAPKPVYSFRRDTLPPLLGMVTALLCLVALNFQWMWAQLHYNLVTHQPVQVLALDTSGSPHRPDEAPSVWIPKINVHAPVIFESSSNEHAIQLALRDGVVHYPMTAAPGEEGNVVLFGHSSGQPWAPGNYKFVFTLLNKLKVGDQVVIDYAGTRFIYSITTTYVVDPYQTSVLNRTGEPSVTLITCTPVGTSAKRLVVVAKQVSPKPIAPSTVATDLPVTPNTPRTLPRD